MCLGDDSLHGRREILRKKLSNHTEYIRNHVGRNSPGNHVVESYVLGSISEPSLSINQKNTIPKLSSENSRNLTTNPPSSSSSTTAIIKKKTPHCVNLKFLTKRGYKSFEDWNADPNHMYIGRNMNHCVAGALGSKWGNPYKANKNNLNLLKKCLERYEEHIRSNPDLFNAVDELEGKELGCWCKPYPCHADILIKLFKERHGMNP